MLPFFTVIPNLAKDKKKNKRLPATKKGKVTPEPFLYMQNAYRTAYPKASGPIKPKFSFSRFVSSVSAGAGGTADIGDIDALAV